MAILADRLVTTAVTALAVVVSVDMDAITNALHYGDSKTRRFALTQINQSFGSQTSQPIDQMSAAWILPAIEQCHTDPDPEVVALADKLAAFIRDNTSLTPH